MAFCKYCGHELERDALYCPGCGKKVALKKREKNKVRKKWIILIAAYLVLVVFSFFFGIRYNSGYVEDTNRPGWMHLKKEYTWYGKEVYYEGYSNLSEQRINRTNTDIIGDVVTLYVILISAPFIIAFLYKYRDEKAEEVKADTAVKPSSKNKKLVIIASIIAVIAILAIIGVVIHIQKSPTVGTSASSISSAVTEGTTENNNYEQGSASIIEATASNSENTSSADQTPGTDETTSNSSENPPTEESVDYKGEAEAFLDATTFEIDTPIRVQEDYIHPSVWVNLYYSDRAEELGWRVDFYVNDTKQTLHKPGPSSYEFEEEWDFNVSLMPGNNSVKFELRDNYGNSKIITKDVYFEALAPDCASTISVYTFYSLSFSFVTDSPHWNELEQIESCEYLFGYGQKSNEPLSYNALNNLTIAVNSTAYTPIVMNENRRILRDESSSTFTPIVVDPAYGYTYAYVFIPVDLSKGKTFTITFTNKYGLSCTETITYD